MDTPVGGHAVAEAHLGESERKLRVGIPLLVAIDVTFVFALFAAYVFLRVNNTQGLWFPPGVPPPPFVPITVLSVIIAASGVCYYLGERALHADNQALFRVAMALAYLFMLVSLVGEIWYMSHLPFTTTDGAFASSFITLSGYHVAHLLAATLIGLGFVNRVFHSRYSSENTRGVRAIGYYWYWTVAYGILLWILLLVQPPQVPPPG